MSLDNKLWSISARLATGKTQRSAAGSSKSQIIGSIAGNIGSDVNTGPRITADAAG